MSRKQRALAVLAPALVALFFFLPAIVERLGNPVRNKGPYRASRAAAELIAASQPVDLHADPLLWGRDLLQRGTRGSVDLPRLREAGLLLQVFGIVTQAPRKMLLLGNSIDDADLVTPLSVISLWPWRTWTSRRERALFLAERMRDTVARSQGDLRLVLTRADLEALLAARARGEHVMGALLALEGSQALEGRLDAVDALYDAGVRMMAPTHFVDTEVAGSAHGTARGGLSALGLAWLAKLEAKHIVVDLAHASPQTVSEVLAHATRPVVVSHTGIKATCDNPRNLSNEQLQALARNGAVIGIGYWETAVCGNGAPAIAHALRTAADLIGPQHLSLGSDFDGAVPEPFDVTALPLIVDALRVEKFSDDEIRGILGANALRVLLQTLP